MLLYGFVSTENISSRAAVVFFFKFENRRWFYSSAAPTYQLPWLMKGGQVLYSKITITIATVFSTMLTAPEFSSQSLVSHTVSTVLSEIYHLSLGLIVFGLVFKRDIERTAELKF